RGGPARSGNRLASPACGPKLARNPCRSPILDPPSTDPKHDVADAAPIERRHATCPGRRWAPHLTRLISIVYNLSMFTSVRPATTAAIAALGMSSSAMSSAATTSPGVPTQQVLRVADGTIAYDDQGSGPLVIALPGLGDLRQSYRFLAPQLAAAGFRVLPVDLRGHGGSSVGWTRYDASAIGQDILDLIDHVEAGPATIIGNSFSAAAAVWAATEQPAAVAGTVLIGPFVRAAKLSRGVAAAMTTLFHGPWSVRAWTWYHGTLFPAARPADHDAYRRALRANLAEPGRFQAVRAMVFR